MHAVQKPNFSFLISRFPQPARREAVKNIVFIIIWFVVWFDSVKRSLSDECRKKSNADGVSFKYGFNVSRLKFPIMFCVKLWVLGSWRAGNAGQRCNGLDGIGRAGQRVAPDECAIRVNRDNGRRRRTGNPEETRLLGSGMMNASQQGQPDDQRVN